MQSYIKENAGTKINNIDCLLSDILKSATDWVTVNFKNKSSNKYWFTGLEINFFESEPVEILYLEKKDVYAFYTKGNTLFEIPTKRVEDLIVEVIY